MKKLLLIALIISLISCNDSPYPSSSRVSGTESPAPKRIIPEEPKFIDIDTAFVRANKR